MKKKKLISSFFVTVLAALFSLVVFGGCSPRSSEIDDGGGGEPETDYEFVFTGSAEFNTGELNVTVYGNTDGTITLSVAEYPQVRLSGTWVLYENEEAVVGYAGYKIYFNDDVSSYEYCRFDETTSTFTFSYQLDLGSVIGSASVSFSYVDTDFVYDGIGLGPKPPVFTANDGELLTCNEDGTFVSGYRTGTWDYDEEENKYIFEFENGYALYSTNYQRNEAWDGGYYCGYNRVDGVHLDDSSTGERQFQFLDTDADPICITIEPTTWQDLLPMNRPYKDAAEVITDIDRIRAITGKDDFELAEGEHFVYVDVAGMDNSALVEIIADMEDHRSTYHGENATSPVTTAKVIEDYNVLPAIWYVIDETTMTYDFMSYAETTYDEATNTYSLIWSNVPTYIVAKYQVHVGTYVGED